MTQLKYKLRIEDGLYKKCPVCAKHFIDLRLHVWSSHLDAKEKSGLIDPKKDYSKLLKFIPKKK